MAEQTRVCVCPQCGKKYALKEGFDAKSFSCKACGATVWVAGKPPAPVPTTKGPAPAPRAGSKGARGGRAPVAAASHGTHRRSRRGGREEATEEGGRRGREKPKSNTNLFLAIGGVAVVGIVIVVIVMSGKKEPAGTGTTVGQQPGGAPAAATTDTTPAPSGTEPAAATPAGGAPAAVDKPKPEEGKPAPSGGEPAEESPSPEGGETEKPKLGDRPPAEKKSKWDPPATLGHLDSTSPEQRKQIDDLIAILLDPDTGREVHEAKEKLTAIGKPAFLPVLGKMAAIRDSLTDDDSMPERRIESALMQGDQCLRGMDGYLDAHEKGIIRPGERKDYIEYVLRIHYRRWMDGMGSTALKDMETMPGAYDASTAYKDEGAEEEEK